jgi:hypothetical protein
MVLGRWRMSYVCFLCVSLDSSSVQRFHCSRQRRIDNASFDACFACVRGGTSGACKLLCNCRYYMHTSCDDALLYDT